MFRRFLPLWDTIRACKYIRAAPLPGVAGASNVRPYPSQPVLGTCALPSPFSLYSLTLLPTLPPLTPGSHPSSQLLPPPSRLPHLSRLLPLPSTIMGVIVVNTEAEFAAAIAGPTLVRCVFRGVEGMGACMPGVEAAPLLGMFSRSLHAVCGSCSGGPSLHEPVAGAAICCRLIVLVIVPTSLAGVVGAVSTG